MKGSVHVAKNVIKLNENLILVERKRQDAG